MDMSFANQSLTAEWLTNKNNVKKLEKNVYPVPMEIDRRIALHKLKSMNVKVDELTKTQQEYMDNWQEGT
jgi:adenosylhomocysteinase